ncbi:extracellular solute-binding protein [Helicobacter ailurogastricus]|uniref:extracellular solute-binding protein n=1 Tax=Helicobacter ailurogastricus TaxID=1578720 RepID=UPI0022C0883D|nr:extracellular solute-binding protein [Helicobacter ailurogastricus]GLH57897.1 Oligopeptide ABC transporter periplasmic oligopeptide-binding protein OppA [Helicobacter ailurogastricus]GLH59346.1 Oligopeptide ABC transporter periplasmic oligopeptide-binding protein OppA [Helicobacter ailurogastricus]
MKLLAWALCGVWLGATPFIALGESAKYQHNFTHFNYANPNAPKGGLLKNYALGTFDSLNPFLLKGTKASGLELVYDTLLAQSLDEPYAQYALIANDIQVAKDNSYVIFGIDKRAKFSDGVAILASDVKFSFDILMQKGSPVFRQYYHDIQEAVVLDKWHVKFTFKNTHNRELPLILGQLQILPKHFFDTHDFNNPLLVPVSSGPYTIKTFALGKQITYERNKNYWARDLPVQKGSYNFDLVRFDYYKDDSVALQAFLSGAYDWRFESTAKVWARGYVGKGISSGRIHKVLFKHALPSGMQGFFMNTRRELFKDIKVREALFYAFDFEWANQNLFFSQYKRTKSYFSNSVFASSGLPQGQELQDLEKFKSELEKYNPRIFTTPYLVPSTNGPIKVGYNRRENLKHAQALLKQAGYVVVHDQLVNAKTHKPFVFTMLLNNEAFERLALAYAKNLKVLGITMQIQRVDLSQYMGRVKKFDYDMVVGSIGQSLFPGNEQRYFWGSASATQPGSQNYAGIANPAIDGLIDMVIKAKDRPSQISAVRALDRVLLWGFYVIPHFHAPFWRIAYWDKIAMLKNPPYGFSPYLWWDKNLERKP